jgi:hypothetical protein
VEAGGVEPGEPHVTHQHDPERVRGVAEAVRERLAPRLVADVRLPVGRIGGGAGHHDLDRAPVIVVMRPVGMEPDQLAVELDADAPAHADDHGLAVHGLEALLEVLDDVLGHDSQTPLRADDGFELGPLGLELLLALDLLALGGLLELRVDLRAFRLVERELGEPALVVDRHRGAVRDGALDVVDADVVAEDRARVRIAELDRRAGEADERGMRQGVAHVAREAVDEVVLAAVRFVGHHHDVAALRERRVPVALLLGEELVDGGEHHAARNDRQELAQVRPALGLHRRLAQEVLAAGERAEELVVEVVAVGEHDQGRVLHRRLADDAPGVEGHGQALARALRVPDDANAPVAGLAARLEARLVPSGHLRDTIGAGQLGCPQRFAHRHLHRVELVVARHLLDEAAAAAFVLEDDEVSYEVEESPRSEDALDHDLQLGHVGGRQTLAGDGAPGLEPLAAGRERADAGLDAV